MSAGVVVLLASGIYASCLKDKTKARRALLMGILLFIIMELAGCCAIGLGIGRGFG